jgi:hypothetical protein
MLRIEFQQLQGFFILREEFGVASQPATWFAPNRPANASRTRGVSIPVNRSRNGSRRFKVVSVVVGLTLRRITPGWRESGRTDQSPKCSSRVMTIRLFFMARCP